jgi:hypothetical protein
MCPRIQSNAELNAGGVGFEPTRESPANGFQVRPRPSAVVLHARGPPDGVADTVMVQNVLGRPPRPRRLATISRQDFVGRYDRNSHRTDGASLPQVAVSSLEFAQLERSWFVYGAQLRNAVVQTRDSLCHAVEFSWGSFPC